MIDSLVLSGIPPKCAAAQGDGGCGERAPAPIRPISPAHWGLGGSGGPDAGLADQMLVSCREEGRNAAMGDEMLFFVPDAAIKVELGLEP